MVEFHCGSPEKEPTATVPKTTDKKNPFDENTL